MPRIKKSKKIEPEFVAELSPRQVEKIIIKSDKRFKTFPLKILSKKLEEIKYHCEDYKQATGMTKIIHDWILEAIEEKLNNK